MPDSDYHLMGLMMEMEVTLLSIKMASALNHVLVFETICIDLFIRVQAMDEFNERSMGQPRAQIAMGTM